MKALTCPAVRDQGSAILTAVFFVFIISMIATSMAVMLQDDMRFNRRSIDRIKANEVADGAAAQALSAIAEDPVRVITPPDNILAGTIGDGTYGVGVTQLGGSSAVIVATGRVRRVSRQVKVYFSYPNASLALDYAMFSNDNIRLTGGGACKHNLKGACHSNKDGEISGHVEVSGDVTCVGSVTITGAASVSGQALPNAPRIEFPVLDFDHYYAIAEANDEIYTAGNKAYNLRGEYHPAGGVMWIIGDVNIATHTSLYGALFATGDIHQAGQCDIYAGGDLPAMASRFGDIHLSGHSDAMEGLIYAGLGSVDLTGYHRITGAIVAWGEIFSRGNWELVDHEESDPVTEGENTVRTLAWEY